MIIEKRQLIFDNKLNRFRHITEKEELERDLNFYLSSRIGNTCDIKETKDKLKEVKKEFQEKLKNLFENRKKINNKIKSLRNKIERKK